MALFDLTLNEGLNCISIPLILDGDNAKWSTILQGIAFNSVRTLINGEWKDYIRGRSSTLNDFDSIDVRLGYLIDVVRVGTTPVISLLLPNEVEQSFLDYNDSVYNDESVTLLESMPLRYSGALWLQSTSADFANSDASYISFTVDRAVNVYVAYDSSASTVPSWLDDWDETGEIVVAGGSDYNLYRLPFEAGNVTIPGNQFGGGDATQMYLVFVEENLFPLTVTTPVNYQIASYNEGRLVYLDRLYIITDLPEEVENIDWIRINNDEYTDNSLNYMIFEVLDECYVYVAYPTDGNPIPQWLEDFDQLDEILVSNALDFQLYRKWFDTGTVTLGGASAPTALGPDADPGANYLVGIKKIGPASVTISLEGEEPDGITDIPIVGTDKGGVSLIGFPKSVTGEQSIATNIDARGLQYQQLMRLRRTIWDAYIPTRDSSLNWIPSDLERGLGYIVRSSISEDQVLEIDYDS